MVRFLQFGEEGLVSYQFCIPDSQTKGKFLDFQGCHSLLESERSGHTALFLAKLILEYGSK
jgi:hypothetical protein